MKIIGTSGQDGCIVYLTKDELANLAGFYSSYNSNGAGIKMEPGQIVHMSSLYKDATELVSLYGEIRRDIENNQKRLNKLADMLNPKAPPPKEKSA